MIQSNEVNAMAAKLESKLQAKQITLTMGGEPTYIVAQPDAEEWNNAAMGEQKLGFARRMTAELIRDVYPQALAMQVFGKWYPGEPLPRWNFMTLHAQQGEALWPETKRLMLDDVEGANKPEAAANLIQGIAQALDLEDHIIEAFEQATQHTESRLAGWVLPLDFEDDTWISAKWPFNHNNPMQLFVGDSPVGLRLPLGDLPADTLRKALSVEVRRGAIEIFIPPLDLSEFRILIKLIRQLANSADLHDLLLCGYAPSETNDELVVLGLAADPGVLEVNVPPSKTWQDYNTILTQCTKAAAAVDLQLTKLQLNGSVYGTGGGSHITFGGESLDTNPFLKDPKRISSLLRYWQRHPALSYFFTGQHVGPGSQAPRVDEGPRHGLYELEVACEGLEGASTPPDGLAIDQFLKNLMTDSSGNTHRAELCFDKFYNLASPNGLLGIVEFRAFETYARSEWMSLAALFIRAVLVRLFESPYTEPLKRFGPELHDRYFLPAFLWQDIQAICEDLQAHGIPFEAQWLQPILDFRSPSVGTLEVPNGSIDLRQAFESWPLMAEESRGSSTVRVVDNSTDRIQFTLSDKKLLESGELRVNDVRVPFEEIDGLMICGLRYKCASAYPALHPHVPIQSPLWIEWVDKDSGKTISAAHYHYWNPDAPAYDGRPRTSEIAAERRAARWQNAPELIGRIAEVIEPKLAPEYRFTLDLRRQIKPG
ncbi:transglutaminase family protein [Aliiglaciecola lipolytica]|uniref:DUF2126 domain-containing protein n=1 Tax=Aliiglaciecola lipolytica E3 TaxID=1127673 RepID=K6YNQ6_9ALTE|nr:transglutaminase family protein [Aliiglaciecola lipolytica]GAC12980.1 hypothetical protein GLIP_0330 [Aliiglaciecola lipolytica E3]